MRPRIAPRLIAPALAVLAAAPSAVSAAASLPKIDGIEAVASVNGEPIALAALLDQVIDLHMGVAEPEAKIERPDPSALLDRLITVRLIVQEARSIGLDQLPEIVGQMESIRMGAIKGALVRRAVREVTEPDPAAVEKSYRSAVREWKVGSVLFDAEAEARALVDAVRKGGDFDALAAEAMASGRAKAAETREYERAHEFRSNVAEALVALKVGETGGPVRLDNGFAALRLIDERHPEDPEARQRSADGVLQAMRQSRLREYMDELRDRYAKVDAEVLGSLDFEGGKDRLESLRADQRVVADVKGGEPIRVAELTAAVEQKFYHGVEGAMERGRVGGDLRGILDRLTLERATTLEAKRLGIEKSNEFRAEVDEQVDGRLFATFISKVISPDVKVEEPELKRYYDEHPEEFSSPAMMRLESLAFERREDAESALGRLRQGTEFSWIRENAQGQARSDDHPGLLRFGPAPIAVATMPEDVRKALAGAATGDVRFHAPPEGPCYVLHVRESIEPRPRPYESVKPEIASKLSQLEVEEALEEWSAKLRAASKVEIYATGPRLREILGQKLDGGGPGAPTGR